MRAKVIKNIYSLVSFDKPPSFPDVKNKMEYDVKIRRLRKKIWNGLNWIEKSKLSKEAKKLNLIKK